MIYCKILKSEVNLTIKNSEDLNSKVINFILTMSFIINKMSNFLK